MAITGTRHHDSGDVASPLRKRGISITGLWYRNRGDMVLQSGGCGVATRGTLGYPGEFL